MCHSTICGHLFYAHELQKKTDIVTPRTKQLNALQAEIHKLKEAQQELQKNHMILQAQAQLNLLKQTTTPPATAQPSIAVPVPPTVQSLAAASVQSVAAASPVHANVLYGELSPHMLMMMAAGQPGFAQGFLMCHNLGPSNSK